jgi:hypothetical protein
MGSAALRLHKLRKVGPFIHDTRYSVTGAADADYLSQGCSVRPIKIGIAERVCWGGAAHEQSGFGIQKKCLAR